MYEIFVSNYFSQIILIPELVSQSCLLLNDTLTPTQFGNCTFMTGRSYDTFGRVINGLGTLTGANTLDVAKIGYVFTLPALLQPIDHAFIPSIESMMLS
jgi:hypothetical protein